MLISWIRGIWLGLEHDGSSPGSGLSTNVPKQGFSTLLLKVHFPAGLIESYRKVSLIKVEAKLCRKVDPMFECQLGGNNTSMIQVIFSQ